jgi:hypothetical protein
MVYISQVNSKHYKPTTEEIKLRAKEVGLKTYSPTFAQDLASLAAGEKFRPLSEVMADLKPVLSKVGQKTFKVDSDGDYYTPGSVWGAYTRDRDQKVQFEQEKLTQSMQNMRNYLQHIAPQLDRIPGATPLSRAMNLMKHLGDQAGAETSEGGDPPPFSTSSEKTQEMIEKLESDLEILENLDEDDHELLDSEGDTEKAWLNMDKKIHEIMRVAQFCEGQAKLKVRPQSRLVRDNEGKFTFFRASRDFSDFPKTQRRVLMSRNKIGHKILSQQAKVAERYTKDTPLPFISMILDESGSMDDGSDRKGLGILWYLVKEARRGNCIGLFSFFERKCREFHLLDQSTTIDWFKSISRHDFDGNGTRVGDCALEILAYQDKVVAEKGINVDLSQKHLILVNDGQDPLGNFSEKFLGTSVLHSFILGNKNPGLKKISQATGGMYKEDI